MTENYPVHVVVKRYVMISSRIKRSIASPSGVKAPVNFAFTASAKHSYIMILDKFRDEKFICIDVDTQTWQLCYARSTLTSCSYFTHLNLLG